MPERPELAPTSESLNRRGLIKGAAWSVPVMAVAAATPFAVASQCLLATLNWNNIATGSTVGQQNVGITPALTVTPSISYATGTTQSGTSGQTVAGPQGGIAGRYYRVEYLNPSATASATVTFTFNRAVRNLSFTLADIDANNFYRDSVRVITPGFTFALTNPTLVVGNGQTGNEFRAVATSNVNIPNSDNRGNVTLSWAGAVSSVSFVYRNVGVVGSGNMAIGVSNLTFQACRETA